MKYEVILNFQRVRTYQSKA